MDTKLAPALELYQETMSTGLKMVRHPLVFAVPFFDHPHEITRLNQALAIKQREADKALAERRWRDYVFLHERPYRLEALQNVWHEMKAAERYPLLRAVFIDTENLADNLDDWRELLSVGVGKDIWRTKRKLADTVQIYRGGYPHKGVSWTLSLDIAKWFAKRWNRNLPVYSGVVNKKDIIGYLKDRDEEEIVVFHEHVKDRKIVD